MEGVKNRRGFKSTLKQQNGKVEVRAVNVEAFDGAT